MWKDAYVESIVSKLSDDEISLTCISELNDVVTKSLKKAERAAYEDQKESFLTNYSKELSKLVRKQEKERNSSSGSSIKTKNITEDCLIKKNFDVLLKNYEKGRILHEKGAIGHVSLMHLTNKKANEIKDSANGWTRMTVTSFAYHNTTTWPGQSDGVQYEPVGYWCGNCEGGAEEVNLLKAVGEYTKFTQCGKNWYEFKWPWERIGENKSINEKAVNFAESRLGVPYIPKGGDWQIPYLDNFVKYKWSDDYSYCSQIVWRSFKDAGGKQYDFEDNLSLPWISPNDIYVNHKTDKITSWKNDKK
ncbi:MAG: hypothetical protein IKX23_08405 [Treponema sp.]|nr:hypothetical protein [Treponema sp.]